MATPEILAALAVKYAPPAWVFLPEVRDATGFAGSRTADAIAMGTWPSRGLELHGFEVKASRGDWLRELREPAKAEAFFEYVDRWWIVAGDAKIVAAGELPTTWGLMVMNGRGLKVEREAPKFAGRPMDRGFLAALLRRATAGMIPAASIEAKSEEARAEALQAAQASIERAERERDGLRAAIETFEGVSGVGITPWNAGRIGRAVRQVMEHGTDRVRRDLEGHRAWAQRIIDDAEAVLRDLPPRDPPGSV